MARQMTSPPRRILRALAKAGGWTLIRSGKENQIADPDSHLMRKNKREGYTQSYNVKRLWAFQAA